MAVYGGVCIGGPYDREHKYSDSPSFRALNLPPEPSVIPSRREAAAAAHVAYSSYSYIEPGIWLLDGMTWSEAIIRMAAAYRDSKP